MNLVILILRDDAYGMIRWKQAAMHYPDYALVFGNPDFVKYAESYGAEGHRSRAATSYVRSWRTACVPPAFTSWMCPSIIPKMTGS
jgi:acetolactate synthase-1/2/3 large subunit